MKLSWNWLNSMVKVPADVRQFAADMTMAGQKVESVTFLGEEITRVAVGLLLEVSKHPDADRLSLCQVDVGRDAPIQIVTGATNIKAGDCVPVALHGATLAGGKKIEKGRLRGQKSEGMLCSHVELGLTQNDVPYGDPDGILIFPERHTPGQDVRPLLGLDDYTIEFEITNNRPDCLSVIGLAREAATVYGLEFDTPQVRETARGSGSERLNVTVEDRTLCPRYTARMVENVRIAPSPDWMRHRLRASGIRPINNIVDVTNYVMLEYGQPMHAFDYACCEGGQIVVRTAREGETLVTLDGQSRELTPDMLCICDRARPVGLAGVMGGENSEITEKTQAIVLESANFNGPSVRKTALRLGMRTDASGRFEKGLDILATLPAVHRACQLIRDMSAGEVLDFVEDQWDGVAPQREIFFDPADICNLLGARMSAAYMMEKFNALGFPVLLDGEVMTADHNPPLCVTVPSWRGDLECWQDLAEEVARLYGYDRVESDLPGSRLRGALTGRQRVRRDLAAHCRALGYSEMLTYAFVGSSAYDRLRLPEDDPRRASLRMLNPLGEDTAVMRTTLLPTALQSLERNAAARNAEARLYELARVYLPREGALPEEKERLCLAAYGNGMDFYRLKGEAESILEFLRVEDAEFVPAEDAAFHPGRCAAVLRDGVRLMAFGELHPEVAEGFGLNGRGYALELDLDAALDAQGAEKRYAPLPRYPSVQRDLAVVVDADVPAAEMIRVIRAAAGKLLSDCRLFDVYTGKQVPEGRKSAAFSLTFRSPERTLTDAEADAAVDAAAAKLQSECGAVRR